MIVTASAVLSLLVFSSPLVAGVDASKAKPQATKIASAWFAGWHINDGFPVSAISWEKYTQLTFAFAETTPDVRVLSLTSIPGSQADTLSEFVTAAHSHGVKAKVSIGGWTGSRWFSTNVGSAQNRTAFVKTVTDLATKYELDGVDFDWEYPGSQGIGCNTISPQDTPNFLSFLQELRQHPVGARLILSAATAIFPFIGPKGSPTADVSKFSLLLDYIAIMNYDLWGPWSPTVGPNAPLNDTCAAAANQDGSAVSAIKQWSAAGIPREQLVLGVAGYGHSFRVYKKDAFVKGTKTLAPYPPFDAINRPAGDEWDDPAGTDECGAAQAVGGSIDFWGLIAQGYLTEDGNPVPTVPYAFDTCSQTPYVYNTTTEVMIAFDDARSFAAKGKFIKDNNLAGFAMWEAGSDHRNILINSVRAAAGFD